MRRRLQPDTPVNKHVRQVIGGSLVAVLTFLVGLFSLALLLKVIG